ncbi:MAG: HxlR family transcriptional regulator [Flavobacteriaceae bacterium]|nr:HxlR family transcriptional regulator [Flavobacteriaceae bacterium]
MINITNNRSSCPVSTSLEIIGDHWTLVLIRDFFLNRVTFSDFKNSPEKIATNILTDRIHKLLKYNIIKFRLNPKNRKVKQYYLTDSGIELYPLIYDLLIWGKNNLDIDYDAFSTKTLKKISTVNREKVIQDNISNYKNFRENLLINS